MSRLALAQDFNDKICSSVLSINNSDGAVTATAIVWDYTATEVFLLTNYHTWDMDVFKYCFPPTKSMKRKRPDQDPEHLSFNSGDFVNSFVVTSEVFQFYSREEDFAVLKFPIDGFVVPRITLRLDVFATLKVLVLGYNGHTSQLNISGGEVSGLIPQGFTLNLLSAGGFSGAAIIADKFGRAVGYMGRNLNTSEKNNL